eukprot:2586436-Rhodomonas_salina.2
MSLPALLHSLSNPPPRLLPFSISLSSLPLLRFLFPLTVQPARAAPCSSPGSRPSRGTSPAPHRSGR